MITATLDDRRVLAWLAALGPKAQAASVQASNQILARLVNIIDRRLSGEVLNSRSGALRASLRTSVDLSAGILATVTANTPYAAFQEYGFSGVENVRAHLRHQTQAFGHPIKPIELQVRAHARRVDYPAHSYLRSALAELAPEIGPILADATARVLTP